MNVAEDLGRELLIRLVGILVAADLMMLALVLLWRFAGYEFAALFVWSFVAVLLLGLYIELSDL